MSTNKKHRLRRSPTTVLAIATLMGAGFLYAIPGFGQTVPAGTVIKNQATGSFLDPLSQTTATVQSNEVVATVAEVAGITITPVNTPTAATSSVAFYDFSIANAGNDPTKFFLPTAPSSVVGGTAGTLQVIGFIPAGGSQITLATPINITTAVNTGALSDPTIGGNTTLGSIPVGAAIVVRVPVTVSAAVGAPVTVTLGNTGATPTNNIPYVANTNDLYTVDNADGSVSGETLGVPVNGDATLHRQEASAQRSVNAIAGPSISGTVFEDINYGGGAGRPLSAVGTSARNGVTVELFNSSGTYVSSTTTSGGGKYSFTSGITAGNYYIRVVNSTVTSSRPGSVSTLSAVQTFRTNASTGAAVDDPNRVGGENPAVTDTGAAGGSAKLNTTTFAFITAGGSAALGGQAESISPVTVGAAAISGVDFGYNFDTIVNTNDSGQGSLRQFIVNSNTLTNAGLDQVANPSPAPGTTAVDPAAGEESSIFMIPVAALTSNVAVITPTTTLPTIADSFTTITGTTQSINIGDTNSGQQGAGGTVGVDALALSQVNKPEVQIVGSASFASGLTVSGANTTIRGLSIYGFGRGPGNVIDANIQLANNTANTKIEQNFLGSTATSFSRPAAGTGSDNIFLGTGSTNPIIQNNLIGFANLFGVLGVGTKNLIFQNNEVRQNSFIDAGKDGISLEDPSGNTNNLIQGNLIIDQGGNGIDSYASDGGLVINNNTVTGNGVGSTSGLGETPGVRLYGTGNTVYRNIIFNNYGPGVMATFTSKQGTISQNSIYGNGTILAKNGAAASGQIGIDLLLFAGNPDQTGTAPYVSANDGSAATGGNNGMDYPVISSSSLSAGTLTVSGYIGNNTAGSATFANATVEFFISEGTNQNLGEVIAGDGKSLSHGEGKTYIGSCTANGSGLFTNCTFANAGTLGLTNAQNITATATKDGHTSEFSASPPAGTDYGDAPDTYKTLSASGGPSHTIDNLYLGASVTADANGQPNATATGDTGDDGVTFSPAYGANYSTLVQEGVANNITVVSSGAGFLNAWIDYNKNGVFDTGERIFTNQSVVAGNNNLTFTPPANLLHGLTFARFRVSPTSIATPLPTGAITGGEVEDYQVQVATPIPDGASCVNTGLLNGSFETPAIGLNAFAIQSKSAYPGWNTTATDQQMESWGSGYQGFSSFSGSYFAEMNATEKASLYQDIATVPGSTLTYQFAHRARSLPPTTPAVLVDTAGVSAGAPGAVVSLRTFSTDSNDWVVYRGTYIVPAGQYITRFQFDSINAGIQQVSGFAANNAFGNFIDAVQFSTSSCVTPISPPTIDLDGDNGTAPGNNYQNNFIVGGSPVAAADTDAVITDEKTTITRAIAQLTNPLDGANESLTFNTTLAATFGITVDQAYDSTSGVSTTGRITLKGSATLAQYQQVIATLKYANTKASPTMTDRTINVQVIDSDKAISNTAVSTIKMAIATTINVSGTVFSDANANVTIDGTDAGTNASSSTLTVYVVDTAGKVVDKALVAANGTYTLSSVPRNSTVKLRLSTNDTVAIGATAPTSPSLPSGWYHTGENLNGTIDIGATLGDIDLTTTTANLSNYNFGIQQPPACTNSASDGSYATSGLNKNSIWWLNFECYNEPTAMSASGQPFSFTLPDGSSMTMTVKKIGPKPVKITTTTPTTGPFSTFGTSTQYAGVTGKPAFMNATNPGSGIQDWTETLTSIVVKDKAGNSRNYTFVSADAENSNQVGDPFGNQGLEQLKFATNGTNWSLVELLSKTASAPTNTLTGLSTPNATWEGNGSNNGSLIISTNNPSQVALSAAMGGTPSNWYTSSQAGLFGIGMPKVTLIKQINGRVSTTDQFTTAIEYTAPTVNLQTVTSSGTATSTTTGAISVLPGNVINLKETMAAGSASALTQYSSSIACINANPTSTVLPSGTGTSFTLTPKIGDDITCTLTNRTVANVLLVKRITAINGDRTKNPNDNTPLNVTIDDTLTNDNNANWPNSAPGVISPFLQGVTNAGLIKPGDTIEYTIYFLNADAGNSAGLGICDRITGVQSFLTDAYGTVGSGKDIQFHKGDGAFTTWSSTATTDLTSAVDTGDRAKLVATASVPASCNLGPLTGTDTGTLIVDVVGPATTNQPAWTPLSGSTSAGTANSYGYIRFTTKVNP